MNGYDDFNNYLEYIPDQPSAAGGIFAPQLVGMADYNEFGMSQCPGNLAGSSCPNDPNYPWTYIAQTSNNTGALKMLTMDDESAITDGGGLLFQDGIVTAVFPPNVVASDTVFYNDTPTAYCGGAMPGAVNCPLDPTTEFIVQAGEAREFFPDGTNFDSYVRLIFHYCDNDLDGFVDANTEGIMAATAGGTQSFTYNSLTGDCYIGGAPTGGGTVDINDLAVYNWDAGSGAWLKMEGNMDRNSRTITVYSTHFSRYDTLGFRYGLQSEVVPLYIPEVHTYPNPYVVNRHAGGITFAAGELNAATDFNVEVRIYDIRGSLVTTLVDTVSASVSKDFGRSYPLIKWNMPVNAAGRPLASGVYLYYFLAHDQQGFEITHKGKFTVVR